MKQVHKQFQLTRTKCVNNILKIWKLSTNEDRYDWYAEAYRYAVKINELTCKVTPENINKACGVISALSPMTYWERNKKIALEFIATGDCVQMRAFKEKARQIVNCSGKESEILNILRGQKIQSFYLNIRYPEKAVNMTIDRHALSIALGRWIIEDELRQMTPKQYQFFTSCYRHAGAKLGVNPLLVQSATWLTWRRIKKTFPTVQTRIDW